MDTNMNSMRSMLNTKGLTGRVVMPGSPGYDEARQVYNGRFDKFPAVIVYCGMPQDVVNAVRWVRRQQLPFRIRCGGHSYEAFSLVDGGLVIDVSELVTLQVDRGAGIAQVGAGWQLLPLYEALWNQRVAIPTGTCPTVGISGITLGAGYGLLSRLWGMTCDQLLELELVTVQGNLIRVNERQYGDLFWACRGGGGGNFGVITSFTFRVQPVETVSRYRMTWDFSDLKKVVRHWQNWAPHADARLTSLLLLPAMKQGDLRSNGVFVGLEQELRQLLQPVQEVIEPKTVEFHTLTWIEAVRLFAGRPIKQEKFKNSSAYVYEPLSDAALDVLEQNLLNPLGSANLAALDSYGGNIGRISPTATAFPHRKALFVFQYQSYWQEGGEETQNIQWIENFRNSMSPYTSGAYRNYSDALIPDWPASYYGPNLARLKRVKQKYDPENFFHFEQSIPTEV